MRSDKLCRLHVFRISDATTICKYLQFYVMHMYQVHPRFLVSLEVEIGQQFVISSPHRRRGTVERFTFPVHVGSTFGEPFRGDMHTFPQQQRKERNQRDQGAWAWEILYHSNITSQTHADNGGKVCLTKSTDVAGLSRH
jgi:hypothetical protein